MLEQEYQFFLDHRDDLLKEHRGKYLVIVGCSVVGVYGTEVEAYIDSLSKYEAGSFLIQYCEEERNIPIATFHSRVFA